MEPPPPEQGTLVGADSGPNQGIPEQSVPRGVPRSHEGEQFVLGTILLDDSKFPEVAGRISDEDFFSSRHKRIFACMRQIYERGERIEYLALINELTKVNQLEKVGGVALVAGLTQGMPRGEFLGNYLKIVKDKAILRKLIHAATSIVEDGSRAEREVEEILADAETQIMRIGSDVLRSGLESPEETIKGFPGGLDAFLDPSKRTKGISSPFQDLERMTNGFLPGQLVILAARPAMGKTAMALNIATHVAAAGPGRDAKIVALFSLEMSRESLLTRVLCSEAEVNHLDFRRGRLRADARHKLMSAAGRLIGYKLYIDDTAELSIFELGAKCRRLQAEQGLDLVIVDYLQLMASKGRIENRVQEISAFSRGLKLLAKDLAIPVIALSQLSRGPESKGRKSARPRLSDLRDSGSIEQDADVVCFIYRGSVYRPNDPELLGKAELIIGKQRNGPTGTVHLVFRDKFASFHTLDPTDREDPGPPAPGVPEDEPVPF